MQCPSCGARYDKRAINCPFCKSENQAEADRRHKEQLQAIDHQISHLQFLPYKLVKVISKHGIKMILILLVLIFIISVIMASLDSLKEVKLINEREDHKEVLEALFIKGEYGQMYDYYRNNSQLYGDMYEKYREVWSSYNSILAIRHSVACLTGEIKEFKYGIHHALYQSTQALRIAVDAVEDNMPKGNESVLESFIQEVYNYFDLLQLTEDEIEELLLHTRYEDAYFNDKTEELLHKINLLESYEEGDNQP